MEKYYTPAIDHFHIGFEYQWKNTDNFPFSDWMQGVVKDGKQIDDIFNSIYDIRVKHIDRQDIESEGFCFNVNYADYPEYGFLKEDKSDTQYLLYWNVESSNIRIERIVNCGTGNDDYLFNGTIRNISEFRRLLKQLNIK